MKLPRLKPSEWILAISIVVLFLSLVTAGEWGSRSFRHCVLCRTVRVQHSYCGSRWDEYQDNTCTDWYRAHIAASHTHLWVKPGTSSSTYDAFGRVSSVSDNVDHLSALLLTPEEQIEVYRRIDDPIQAVQLFTDLQAYVVAKDKRGQMIAGELQRWVTEDRTVTTWDALKDRMAEAGYLYKPSP